MRMRIMVVEDDLLLQRSLTQLLRESGYAVDAETDAGEALIAFELEPVDLVVLDLRLPGMPGGGVELCRRMREISTETPILMLTALDSARNKATRLT